MTKIVGIDCSTNSLAFSVWEDKKLVRWGEVGFGKGDMFHRMNNANNVVRELSQMDIFQDVNVVFFESATYIQNKATVIKLAYAFGAAIAPFIKPGVVAHDVTPMTWQNYIGNKAFTKDEKAAVESEYPGKTAVWYKNKLREIRKERNIKFVKDNFGVDAENDNVADAICIGWFGINHHLQGGK